MSRFDSQTTTHYSRPAQSVLPIMNGPYEKTFKQLWRELSKQGWKSRKPKGLSVDFTYVKPGVAGSLDAAQRRVDHFVGKLALNCYLKSFID